MTMDRLVTVPPMTLLFPRAVRLIEAESPPWKSTKSDSASIHSVSLLRWLRFLLVMQNSMKLESAASAVNAVSSMTVTHSL